MNRLSRMSLMRRAQQAMALVTVAAVLSSCGWRGIANLPVPGGSGTGSGAMTIYVQMPDTLALNANSQVKVADVNVGTVRAITMKNWVATLTVGLRRGVKLPANATARIGQTSLLGSQHVELAAPKNPSPQPLRSGDTIPLKNSSAYPTTERVLAGIATLLLGGGFSNLEVITSEVYNIINGRADQVREFLYRLDGFIGEINRQRDDLARALDSSNRLLAIVAHRNDTLDQLLTELPPLAQDFADKRDLFTEAVQSLGRASKAADDAVAPSSDDLHTNLQMLQRPLCELSKASPYLFGALKLILSFPFNIDTVKKFTRGDYFNASGVIDLTLSAIDNASLSGTGFSGALRALEQSWGRDPATMIPDVRFTPNPHDAPNGPLVERGSGIC
jgi:phospholipid/cholesterol/gamma-HCH transport system substrate-binding protein